MRIALVIYGELDTRSGGFRYDRMVVDELVRRGHSVEVISLPWRSYVWRLAQNWSKQVHMAFTRCCADVVVQDELNHPSLFYANGDLKPQGGPPICALVHHLRSDEDHPAWATRLYRAVERAYLRSVNGVICNSRTTLARVTALAGTIPETCVAYPAGDHVAAPDADQLLRQRRSSTRTGLRILFVGNVIARKRLHDLIKALARVRHACRLTVAGSLEVDRRYAAKVRSLAARLGLADRVTFLGRVSEEMLHGLYASHDLLALPSFEGYGIAYLEAMAFALPCLASTAGAAHEIVTHGINGFLVEPGDIPAIAMHLEALAADRARLASMAEAARARFDAQPTWADTTTVVEAFLGRFAG